MVYLKELNTLFIHIQRTGGSSIVSKFNLHDLYIIYTSEQHDNFKSVSSDFIKKHRDTQKVAFVRNPWERIFSWYKLIHGAPEEPDSKAIQTFEKWLFDYAEYCKKPESHYAFHFNQHDYLPRRKDGSLDIWFLGRFEQLQLHTTQLFNQLGLARTFLEPLNGSDKTASFTYRDFYSDTARDFVAEACAEDLLVFGYGF